MPVEIAKSDLEFLKRVCALGLAGSTQDEIADELGMSRTNLRYRLSSLGFEFEPVNDLRATLSKRRFSDLIARGELQAAKEPACEAA